MKIYKMCRDMPEVTGGKTTADVPETALEEALSNGWKISEEKSSPSKENENKADEVSAKPETAKVTDVHNETGDGTAESAPVRNSRSRRG